MGSAQYEQPRIALWRNLLINNHCPGKLQASFESLWSRFLGLRIST